MSSQLSPVTPGSLVMLDKSIVEKLKLKSSVGIVKMHYRDGVTTVTMAMPIVRKVCNNPTCRGSIRTNHRHGLGTCTKCNKRFGVKPTKEVQNIPTGSFSEIIFPEDRD